jgi:integrase
MPKSPKEEAPAQTGPGAARLRTVQTAVLNTLTSKKRQRSYDRAIADFVDWYCSEPRLAFNRTVVPAIQDLSRTEQYPATTINLRLAAVRRVAFEAADSGLLSPELAAGIRRVKGVRRIGVRVGNWLTAEQAKRLLAASGRGSLRGKREYAIISMLIGCGLRRSNLLAFRVDSIQSREDHWVVADLWARPGTSVRSDPSVGENCRR